MSLKTLNAQLTYQGLNTFGTSQDGNVSLRQLGLVCEIQADQGMIKDSNNRVQCWTDMSGSGNNFTMYIPTNSPSFSPSFTTNNLPTVFFTNNVQRIRLINNSLGTLFSGINKPITIITLINAETNTQTATAIGLGWTSASNSSASVFAISPNSNVPTTRIVAIAVDTNQIAFTRTITLSTTTNTYSYLSTTYDGANLSIWDNLRNSSSAYSSGVPRTCNTFTIGCLSASNQNLLVPWNGYLSAMWVFTNGLSGTQMTNVLNTLNVGPKKVF